MKSYQIISQLSCIIENRKLRENVRLVSYANLEPRQTS